MSKAAELFAEGLFNGFAPDEVEALNKQLNETEKILTTDLEVKQKKLRNVKNTIMKNIFSVLRTESACALKVNIAATIGCQVNGKI